MWDRNVFAIHGHMTVVCESVVPCFSHNSKRVSSSHHSVCVAIDGHATIVRAYGLYIVGDTAAEDIVTAISCRQQRSVYRPCVLDIGSVHQALEVRIILSTMSDKKAKRDVHEIKVSLNSTTKDIDSPKNSTPLSALCRSRHSMV
jgi:hypothetical protein